MEKLTKQELLIQINTLAGLISCNLFIAEADDLNTATWLTEAHSATLKLTQLLKAFKAA